MRILVAEDDVDLREALAEGLALEGYAVIRLQAEDLAALTRLPGFGAIRGLPAFAVYKGAAGY